MEEVEETLKLMEEKEIQVDHVLREANQLADYIANTTINSEEKHVFSSFIQLPMMARKLINMDKHEIPSLQIKTRSKNILVYTWTFFY